MQNEEFTSYNWLAALAALQSRRVYFETVVGCDISEEHTAPVFRVEQSASGHVPCV
jgi:hypothetical protein